MAPEEERQGLSRPAEEQSAVGIAFHRVPSQVPKEPWPSSLFDPVIKDAVERDPCRGVEIFAICVVSILCFLR
jgi:hypothetical protein